MPHDQERERQLIDKMTDKEWFQFLCLGREILGLGANQSHLADSWFAFTTFNSLSHIVNYWNNGFPDVSDLLEDRTRDGGLWMQSFLYSDIAHIVLPRTFYWEKFTEASGFEFGYKQQDLDKFSAALQQYNIKHRTTDLVLEIKLY